MKRIFLASFVLILVTFLLLGKFSHSNAALIFSDSFSGGYNTSLWTRASGTAVPQVSSFGLKDDGNTSGYGLKSTATPIAKDTIVTLDIKVNTTPSYVYLICRANDANQDFVLGELDTDGTTWGTQFIHGGGGRTQGTNWNTTPGVHHVEVDCTADTVTIKEDGITLYSRGGFQTFATEENQYFELQYRLGNSEFANFSLCDSNGCANTVPTPTPTPGPVSGLQWQSVGNLVAGRYNDSTTMLQDGRVLVAAGRSDNQTVIPYAEIYNPATQSWSKTGNLNLPRLTYEPSLVTLQNGKALLAGGNDVNNNDYAAAELYDPITGQWTNTGSLNTPRRAACMQRLHDGRVLVAAGAHGAPDGNRFLNSTEIYNPDTGTWSYAGTLTQGRDGATCILLHDGRVLIAGGEGPWFVSGNTAEIFDPNTNRWSPAGTMPWGWGGAIMQELPNGKVLVAGGWNGITVFTNAALWDPATNTWTSISPLPVARVSAMSSLLPDGRVIVFGGNNFTGILATSVIFDPSTNTWTNGPEMLEPRVTQTWVTFANGDIFAFAGVTNHTGWGYGSNTAEILRSSLAPVNKAPVVNPIPNATILEGDTYKVTGSFTDPDSTSWTATVDYGDGSGVQSLGLSGTDFSLSHPYKDEGLYTVTVSITDNQGATGKGTATVMVNNAPFTVSTITAPSTPTLVNTTITASANFTDPGVLDTHTAVWNWGDGNTTAGTVTEHNGSGSVNNTHTYTQAGIYTIALTVTDDDGLSESTQYQYVIVYNPNGGFVTGAGQIDSPAGAEPTESSVTGKAQFELNAKYTAGNLVPTGYTKFRFKNGGIDFMSTSYDWMVVTGSKAYLHGHGQVNGVGGYVFIASMVDNNPNTLRIQIIDASSGRLYDNQMGNNIYATAAEPISVGQIQIHQ